MPRVVITAQVEDTAKWEQMFRTRGDLLRSTTSTVTHFATNDANEVVLYAEVTDLDEYFKVVQSAATAEAMDQDGVKRDTVKVFVLDKEFRY